MFYVYILKSLKDHRAYTGFTEDLTNRLSRHNSGRVTATRNRKPLQLLYLEEIGNLNKTRQRESYWKSGAGRRKLKKFFKDGFPPIKQ